MRVNGLGWYLHIRRGPFMKREPDAPPCERVTHAKRELPTSGCPEVYRPEADTLKDGTLRNSRTIESLFSMPSGARRHMRAPLLDERTHSRKLAAHEYKSGESKNGNRPIHNTLNPRCGHCAHQFVPDRGHNAMFVLPRPRQLCLESLTVSDLVKRLLASRSLPCAAV
jgi:hypothetical protein